MFHLIAAGTVLYRVTDILRTWDDVVSGVGAYFTSGGRYNRVQQRTVYAALDPMVSVAESAAHVALDRWQPRIGQGLLSVQPALPAPVPPLVSEHWLWCFKLDADMQLVDVEDAAARLSFNHRLYELLNPSEAYRTTADLADAIRLYPHPQVPHAMADGILAASVRMPSTPRHAPPPALPQYVPRQQVFFVPPNQLTIPVSFIRRWRMELEFADSAAQSVDANTRVVDWSNPWFRLTGNRASVPAFSQRPNAQRFAPGIWHQFRVKYT
jgi:hypothetical protein